LKSRALSGEVRARLGSNVRHTYKWEKSSISKTPLPPAPPTAQDDQATTTEGQLNPAEVDFNLDTTWREGDDSLEQRARIQQMMYSAF
jgi:hypothetical protein